MTDGAPDFSHQNDRGIDLFLQTDVIIAFDLYKVSSACRMLATAQDMEKHYPTYTFVSALKLSVRRCYRSFAVDHFQRRHWHRVLHFEFRDSVHIRLSKSAHDLSAALRSIGCKIIIDLNPARGDHVPLQRLDHTVCFSTRHSGITRH